MEGDLKNCEICGTQSKKSTYYRAHYNGRCKAAKKIKVLQPPSLKLPSAPPPPGPKEQEDQIETFPIDSKCRSQI